MKVRTGRCQCGEICYKSEGDPLGLYICHCRECKKQSASAFGITLEVSCAGFHLVEGTPKFWTRETDSGKKLKCAFCPTCGSRVWHEYDPPSETISIKGGSLDEPVDVSKAVHVWVKHKLPGIIIPNDATQFLEEE